MDLLIGPGFQLILEFFDFDLLDGHLVVRPFNAPGLFMAVLWIAYLIFIMAGYQNIEVEYKYEKLRKEYHNQDLDGHSVEVSSSNEYSTLIEAPACRTSYRWYFLEEALQKELPHSKVTWRTYCDGKRILFYFPNRNTSNLSS